MGQYRLGTISITNGSAAITVSGASAGAENVAVGQSFKVDRDGEVVYQIASRTPSSGATLTALTLSVVYGGVTGAGLNYQITQDYTPNRSYPELAQGDADAADWLTRAIRKIDTDMALLLGTSSVLNISTNQVAYWSSGLKGDAALTWDNANKRLGLAGQGTAAGLLIGGDALWYRSAADIMRTPDSLIVDGIVSIGTTITIGAALGEQVLANLKSLRGVINSGNSTLGLIQLTASDHIYISPDGNAIRWGDPLVALGGGAAPTFGTIGGAGPVTAAQNTWMRIIDSAGASFWVPAWK